MRSSLALVAFVALTTSTSACATARSAQPSHRVRATPGQSEYTLTSAAFAGMDQNQSLYDALRGLRPGFLSFRGVAPTVDLDGVRATSDLALRELPIQWVERVELLTGVEATARFGTSQAGAALLVSTRRH